jgi:hypothetical protein
MSPRDDVSFLALNYLEGTALEKDHFTIYFIDRDG